MVRKWLNTKVVSFESNRSIKGKLLPCRKFFKLTGSESHTLERLNKLIGEDTLAFVRAKEDFKRNKNSPGILYSDVIRQSFKSVPYFHYAEDSR